MLLGDKGELTLLRDARACAAHDSEDDIEDMMRRESAGLAESRHARLESYYQIRASTVFWAILAMPLRTEHI